MGRRSCRIPQSQLRLLPLERSQKEKMKTMMLTLVDYQNLPGRQKQKSLKMMLLQVHRMRRIHPLKLVLRSQKMRVLAPAQLRKSLPMQLEWLPQNQSLLYFVLCRMYRSHQWKVLLLHYHHQEIHQSKFKYS